MRNRKGGSVTGNEKHAEPRHLLLAREPVQIIYIYIYIQSLSQDILIILPQRPRSEKPLQTSGSRTFLSLSCFSIANEEAVSRSAVLLLRMKALALQNRPLFVLFALAGRTAAILDVAMLCAVEGAQCKTRELP